MHARIRVLVVGPDPRLVRRLVSDLPNRGPVSVAGPVADPADAVDALSRGSTDLVVVDLDRADGRGTKVIAAIADAGGVGRVLAAS